MLYTLEQPSYYVRTKNLKEKQMFLKMAVKLTAGSVAVKYENSIDGCYVAERFMEILEALILMLIEC